MPSQCWGKDFFHSAHNPVIQHHLDAVRMIGGVCEYFLHRAFRQLAGALILFFDNPDTESGPDVRSSATVHELTSLE
jgi:hypothetical protein